MSPSIPAALMLALSGAVGLACTSDDLIAGTEPETSTTFVDPTNPNVFTTGEPDDSTSTGEMPTETTCKKALSCIVNCALMLPSIPPPEQDYSCFLPCIEGMSTEEWLALIDYGDCVYSDCNETARCPDASAKEMTCLGCVIQGIGMSADLMACEQQALACD